MSGIYWSSASTLFIQLIKMFYNAIRPLIQNSERKIIQTSVQKLSPAQHIYMWLISHSPLGIFGNTTFTFYYTVHFVVYLTSSISSKILEDNRLKYETAIKQQRNHKSQYKKLFAPHRERERDRRKVVCSFELLYLLPSIFITMFFGSVLVKV